jgi:hypothetical protein
MELAAGGIVVAVSTSTKEQTEDQRVLSDVGRTLTLFEHTLVQERATEVIRAALSVRPETITIRGVAYNQELHTLTLDGVASSRDALVGYARSLEDTAVFGRVPVSLSDLAKNKEISFQLPLAIEHAAP